MKASVPPDYFEALYERQADPWGFATSDYERAKYEDTLAQLPQRSFGRALEVGCSIGVLSRQLAGRCGRLLAVDVAEAALLRARDFCAGQRNITFELRRIPRDWPPGGFDLILFSEVLYYLSAREIRMAARRACDCLNPGGTIELVHWTGPSGGPMHGDEAAEAFIASCTGLIDHSVHARRERYRLDRLDAL